MARKSAAGQRPVQIASDLPDFILGFARRGGDPRHVLDIAMACLLAVLHADMCLVVTPIAEESSFGIRAAAGIPPHELDDARLPGGADSVTGFAVSCMLPTMFANLDEESRFQRSPLRARYHVMGALVVPVRLAGDVVAVVEVHSRTPRSFQPAEVALVERLGAVLPEILRRESDGISWYPPADEAWLK